MIANAIVEYVDESGEVVAVAEFYDPALDPDSWMAREQKVRGKWTVPHLTYGCGRPLR